MQDRNSLSFRTRAIAAIVGSAVLSFVAFTGANAQDAEKGKYLAAAGDCVSCHTREGGEPFSGGLPIKTPFGMIYTANITSDKKTGIGNFTEEDFTKAMRDGVGSAGHLYPVFPYPNYTKLTDEDIKSIWAYVKTLKAVEYTPPKNDMKFPFGIRPLMMAWNMMFLEKGQYKPNSAQSAEWNRGAYLVEGLGHCGACHTPRNSMGGEKKELAYSGATYIDEIRTSVTESDIVKEDGLFRNWTAVNLTNSPTGLKTWSVEEIAQYLKTGHTAHSGAYGPMTSVVVNSMAELNDADRRAMAVYIKALPSTNQPIEPKASPEQIAKGEVVYTVRCTGCHLPTGLGIPESSESAEKRAPPLVGNPTVQAPDPYSLINIILYGAHEAKVTEASWPKMAGLANEIGFEDEQIADLCTYVRNAWGNSGTACTTAQVTGQH